MPNARAQWHPGFYAGVRAELSGCEDQWTFQSERNLSKKPLQIDLLVQRNRTSEEEKENTKESVSQKDTRKKTGSKGLQSILSDYNIFEYKSPEDVLNIDDYYKVNAYACLFKAESRYVNAIKREDISIILVCSHRPRKLLKYLRESCKMKIYKREKGIYEIIGPVLFSTYIVIAHPKYGGDYPWLNVLHNHSSPEHIELVHRLLARSSVLHDENQGAVIDLVMQANPDLKNKLKEGDSMCEFLREILEPQIAAGELRGELKGEQKGQQKQARLVVKNMFLRGFSPEDASGIAEVDIETVYEWYSELNQRKVS